MRSSPPVPPRETERLAEELRRSVAGEVSWSLGSKNARMALSTLGYGLNIDSSSMADAALAEIFAEMNIPADGDINSMSPKIQNRILKALDKRLRAAKREGSETFVQDVLGARGDRILDQTHKELTLEREGYRMGAGLAEVGKLANNTASRKFHNDISGVHRPDYGRSMSSAVGRLDEIHRQNRDRGTVRPEYDQDVDFVAQQLQAGFTLEKPQGSSIHHLIHFMQQSPEGAVNADFLHMLENNFQSFVVEHDWASAFSKSEDFDGGEVNLPFDYTCFEFRVNGLRVLVPLGKNEAGQTIGCLVSGVNRNWYINQSSLRFTSEGQLLDIDIEEAKRQGTMPKGIGVIGGFIENLGRQIRAVCIMLDAKVAYGEVVKPSEALQKNRRKQGKSPLKSYHVVSLARRARTDHERGDGTGTHKRLHWRRGHWRHYQTPNGKVQYTDDQGILRSKNWIHWMLVGDPDLGFITKHYRL